MSFRAAQVRGYFTESENAKMLMAEYQQDNEPLLSFADEAIEVTGREEDFLPASRIFDEYQEWMEAEHEDRKPLSKRKFTKALRDHLSLGETVSQRVEGTKMRG